MVTFIETDLDDRTRQRHYGLLVGDRVLARGFGGFECRATVVELHSTDNNGVDVLVDGDDEPMKWVAEWCHRIDETDEKE